MKKIIGILTIVMVVLLTTGCTNLTTELKKGNMEVAEKMIENKEGLYDQDPKTGETPLIYAIETKNFELVKKLIETGVSVNSGDGYTKGNFIKNMTKTPLLSAIMTDSINQKEIIELLLKKGAKIDYDNAVGITPMILATIINNNEILKLLIMYGGNVNYKNKYGNSAIFYADSIETCKILLENGADVNIRNNLGENILLFKDNSLYSIKTWLEQQMNLIGMDKEGKINGFLCQLFGVSFMNYKFHKLEDMSCEKKSLELVKFLVEKGIDINAVDKENRNVLLCALNDENKLKYFLSIGVKYNGFKDKDGWGIYSYAKYKNPKIVEVLKKYNIENKENIDYEIPKIPDNKILVIIKNTKKFAGLVSKIEFKGEKEIKVESGEKNFLFLDSGEKEIIIKTKLRLSDTELITVNKLSTKNQNIYFLIIDDYTVKNIKSNIILSKEEKKLIAEISNKEIVEKTEEVEAK